MATAKQFIDAIELQKLVPAETLDELYQEYRSSGGAVTADTLAKRLVEQGALSEEQANVLLQAPSDSFIQVGAESLGSTGNASASNVLGSGIAGSLSGLSNLSSLSGGNVEKEAEPESPFEEELSSKRAKLGEERDARGRRKHVQKKHKNDFDSPLLLIGGGVLALLVLGGAGLALLMNLQSGDQLIDSAKEAYGSGSYSLAREQFEQFVEDFGGHARWSEARVSLTVTRLRQLIETSEDWSGALGVALEEIPQIEDEPAFRDQLGEFASLLPRVARGLAERADAVSEQQQGAASAEADKYVQSATESLTLVNNTKYVPKSLRDDAQIAEIEELLARVARRSEAAEDLAATLKSIQAATSSGDVSSAYGAHSEFIARQPQLREDQRLVDQLAAAVEAERQTVSFTGDSAAAATDNRPTPVALALPLSDRRREGTADAAGVYLTQHRDALYALDAASGALRWRRPIGERLADTPTAQLRDDVFVVDHRYGDLLRLNAASGKLVWRVEIEPPTGRSALFGPVIAGERVLVASESGKLWLVDADTGERSGYSRFAQPLRSAPAVSDDGRRAYVVGEQSSLYTLDTDNLQCLAVRYIGHPKGAVPCAPVALRGRVLVVQNTGEETSELSVYDTDQEGLVGDRVARWRQQGIVSSAPVVTQRRVLSFTELGAVYLYEISAEAEGQASTLIASRGAVNGPAVRRRLAYADGDVWIASVGLVRTAASLADSQLAIRPLPESCDGDRFVGSLTPNGDALLHTRIRQGLPGVTCAATHADSGELIWETDLAAPPLTAPRFAPRLRGVVANTRSGETHLLGPAAIRARVSTKPAIQPTGAASYAAGATLANGVTVLANAGSDRWVATTVSPRRGARRVRLAGEISASPVAMGDQLVTPLKVGQVHLLDAAGRAQATPFQPPIEVGQEVPWTLPAVGEVDGVPMALITDGASTVYCLAVQDGRLESLGKAALPAGTQTGSAALSNSHAAIGLAGGRLATYQAPNLGEPTLVTIAGEIAWGPFSAGETFLVASSDGQLAAIDPSQGAVSWTAQLPAGVPIGVPLEAADGVILVSAHGEIFRLDPSTGDILARADLGQSAGSGATAYNATRLLAAAADGTVLVIDKP